MASSRIRCGTRSARLAVRSARWAWCGWGSLGCRSLRDCRCRHDFRLAERLCVPCRSAGISQEPPRGGKAPKRKATAPGCHRPVGRPRREGRWWRTRDARSLAVASAHSGTSVSPSNRSKYCTCGNDFVPTRGTIGRPRPAGKHAALRAVDPNLETSSVWGWHLARFVSSLHLRVVAALGLAGAQHGLTSSHGAVVMGRGPRRRCARRAGNPGRSVVPWCARGTVEDRA